MNGPDKPRWEKASSEEFDRLIDTWQCISLRPHTDVPPDRSVMDITPPSMARKIARNALQRGT